MLLSDKLKLRSAALGRELAELAAVDKPTDDQLSSVEAKTKEYRSIATQIDAAVIAEAAEKAKIDRETPPDGAGKELAEIRSRARIASYIANALHQREPSGAEAELNAALEMRGASDVPLELMAPAPREERTKTDTDGAVMQSSRWLDRLFASTAAMRLGVTMDSVPAGSRTYPVTTAGADPAQAGREEAKTDAAWTIGTTEIEPARLVANLNFTVEDRARLPGLEMALRRDLAAAMTEKADRIIFLGDAGADEAAGDITGFQGLAEAAGGLQEVDITQANKGSVTDIARVFAGMVDGVHAGSEEDLGVVMSTATNTLWRSTIANSEGTNETVARFLRNNGVTYGIRDGIGSATTANAFAGYVGRMRGINGAAVAAFWENGQLIVDPYTDAKKGMVNLTMTTLWNFKLIRGSHFRRLKYVA